MIRNLFLVFLTLSIAVGAQASGSRGIAIAAKKQNMDIDLGTYRALIIGNNDYVDPERNWKPLETAVSDAKSVASVLREYYGFTDVKRIENATRKDILFALRELTKRAQPNDSVLLYYAGHGYLDQDTNRGYWIPVDAEGLDHSTFVRNSTIRDEVSLLSTKVKHTLLISDSCFSGSLLRGGNRGIALTEKTDAYYQKIAQKRSAQIMAAGGVEFVDDNYKASGHSPFTYFLLNELSHNDQPILTATELASNVGKAVANNVDQVPESGVLYGAGDELGEFLFIRIKFDPKQQKVVDVQVEKQRSPTSSNPPQLLPLPSL